ncbi:MAG: CsiV family protein [Gammaproteobacteria bacterium]
MRESELMKFVQSKITQVQRFCGLIVCSAVLLPGIAVAQNSSADNWFQIEVTLFTFEDANLAVENWPADKLSIGFPERLRQLKQLSDILQLSKWSTPEAIPDTIETIAISTEPLELPVLDFGPAPYAPKESLFQLPDLERDALFMLPPDDQDFIGTNRALSQSADQRIVYHAAWRQLLTRRASANAIAIMGGRRFQDRREVEGSLNFYLTGNADRVILESNLWLNNFATQPSEQEQWTLPVLPEMLVQAPLDANQASTQYFVNRIIAFQQNRDIRADEFHYLDNPAMGMLVQVTPYEVPPLPLPPLELPSADAAIPVQ